MSMLVMPLVSSYPNKIKTSQKAAIKDRDNLYPTDTFRFSDASHDSKRLSNIQFSGLLGGVWAVDSANTSFSKQNYRQALQEYREAHKSFTDSWFDNTSDLKGINLNISKCLYHIGIEDLEKGDFQSITSKIAEIEGYGKYDPQCKKIALELRALSHLFRGNQYLNEGNGIEALKFFQTAYEMDKQFHGKDTPATCYSLSRIVYTYALMGELDEAFVNLEHYDRIKTEDKKWEKTLFEIRKELAHALLIGLSAERQDHLNAYKALKSSNNDTLTPDAFPRYFVFSYQDIKNPVALEIVQAMHTANGPSADFLNKHTPNDIELASDVLSQKLKDAITVLLMPTETDPIFIPPVGSIDSQPQTIIDLTNDIAKTRIKAIPNLKELKVRVIAQQLFSQLTLSKLIQPVDKQKQLVALWTKLINKAFKPKSMEHFVKEYNLYGPSTQNPNGKFNLNQFLAHQLAGKGLARYWGQDGLKQDVIDRVISPALFEKTTLGALSKKSFGWLFHGLSGSGKTYLAKLLAEQLGLNPIMLTKADVSSPYKGMFEANVLKKFEIAKKSAEINGAAVIICDDLEQMGLSRNPNQKQPTSSDAAEVSSLLSLMTQYLDENKQSGSKNPIFIIGTGNHPEFLDAALKENHRLGENLNVGLPDLNGRLAILKSAMQEYEVLLEGENPFGYDAGSAKVEAFARYGAQRTEGMTASQLIKVIEHLSVIPTAKGYRFAELDVAIAKEVADIQFRMSPATS